MAEPELSHAPEVLDENRFLAARDGIRRAAAGPAPRPLRARPRGAWRRWSTPAGRTPARWAASASWRCSPTSPATRARRASARSPPSRAGIARPAAHAAGASSRRRARSCSPPRRRAADRSSLASRSSFRHPVGWSRGPAITQTLVWRKGAAHRASGLSSLEARLSVADLPGQAWTTWPGLRSPRLGSRSTAITARWSLPGIRTTVTRSTRTRRSTSTWSIVSGSARRCAAARARSTSSPRRPRRRRRCSRGRAGRAARGGRAWR